MYPIYTLASSPLMEKLVMREWNPLWEDTVDWEGHPAYRDTVRKMIMTSINWIEERGRPDLQWKERNVRAMLQAMGHDIPDHVPDHKIAVIGPWEEFFRPLNQETTEWFEAIVASIRQNNDPRTEPSAHMMQKAVYCGMLFRNKGWDEFNNFMLQRHSHSTAH